MPPSDPRPPGAEPPGYRCERLLGVGPSGEAWTAVDSATGEARVLRRLRPALAVHAAERLLAASPAAPGFVVVRGLVTTGREVSLVSDLAARGSVRVAGAVPPAWFAALAERVADLHAGGTAYGALTPANVLVGADGLLLDVDVSRLLGALGSTAHRGPYADEPPTPAGDVRALALLCLRFGGDDVRDALRAVVTAAPADRPTMRELAALLDRASTSVTTPVLEPPDPSAPELPAAPPPVVSQPPPPQPSPTAARSRRWPVAALVAALVVAGIGLGAVAGQPHQTSALATLPVTPSPAASSPTEPSSAGDWLSVVRTLEQRRAAALQTLDPVALSAVYAAGSPQRDADVTALTDLRAGGGVRVRGYESTVVTVHADRPDGDRVAVMVTDALSAYDVVDAGGRVLHHAAARSAQTFRVVLARDEGSWRLWSVRQA